MRTARKPIPTISSVAVDTGRVRVPTRIKINRSIVFYKNDINDNDSTDDKHLIIYAAR